MTTRLRTPEDRTLSPFTGYTRESWIEITERIVAGLIPYLDTETGIVRFPRDPRETALDAQLRNPGGEHEAFERTFMAVAAYIAGTGRTAVPGHDADLAAAYRNGIRTFSDPESPRYSPRRGLSGSTLSMLTAPEQFLDGLDPDLRQMVIEHCKRFIHRGHRDCNTLTFAMMPAAILERYEADYDRAMLDGHFDAILSMYRGDGWFIDGWNRGFDHYNFWGFQLYLNAFMRYVPRWREAHEARVREITRAHERTLPFYFGRDGGPIPKGRSLNYRFATASGIAYAQLSGLSNLDPGQARRMASGCLKYFWDHGCLSERGMLERGFRGANTAVGEDYTDLGAPYWACTTLAALALPADHPFWTAEEKPIAADTPGVKRCLVRGAQMLLKVDGDRGEARMLTVGEPFYHRRVWQAGSKYFQHAYSSTLGYALAGDLGPELAAGRTGMSGDGAAWVYRTWPRVLHMDDTSARSEWDAAAVEPRLPGSVVTESIFLDRGEVHVFWYTAEEPRWLTIGGYACRIDHGETYETEPIDRGLALRTSHNWSVMRVLTDVPGELTVEEVRPRAGFAHSHIFEGWAAFPRWTSDGPIEPDVKVAVFVDAARKAECPEPQWASVEAIPSATGLVIRTAGRTHAV